MSKKTSEAELVPSDLNNHQTLFLFKTTFFC